VRRAAVTQRLALGFIQAFSRVTPQHGFQIRAGAFAFTQVELHRLAFVEKRADCQHSALPVLPTKLRIRKSPGFGSPALNGSITIPKKSDDCISVCSISSTLSNISETACSAVYGHSTRIFRWQRVIFMGLPSGGRT